MSTISLDEIRADTERKYAPVVIVVSDGVVCTLRQAMRLPKEQRKHIATLQEQVNDIDQKADDAEEQMIGLLADILRTAATDSTEAEVLLAAVGDDVTVLLGILETYGKATQLPEASPSPT